MVLEKLIYYDIRKPYLIPSQLLQHMTIGDEKIGYQIKHHITFMTKSLVLLKEVKAPYYFITTEKPYPIKGCVIQGMCYLHFNNSY